MTQLEYRLSAAVLRMLGWLFSRLPLRRNRVVLATARTSRLDGNLLHLHRAIQRLRPRLDCALVLEPYSYGLAGKLVVALRLDDVFHGLPFALVMALFGASIISSATLRWPVRLKSAGFFICQEKVKSSTSD